MFRKITPGELSGNVFEQIGTQWMLISAGDRCACNTMTASWGGLGVLWGGPVATVYVRPQRYTRQFLDEKEYFSLCFFGEQWRPQLSLCGSESGRDTDKIARCGFHTAYAQGDTPWFEQAQLVLICRKQYVQPFDPECFTDVQARERWYPNRDWHTMYIGEIVEVLKRD